MSRKVLEYFWGRLLYLPCSFSGTGTWEKMRGSRRRNREGTELVESLPAENQPSQTAAGQDVRKEEPQAEEYQFVLVNNNNYVAVYKLPENEIYEYTDE